MSNISQSANLLILLIGNIFGQQFIPADPFNVLKISGKNNSGISSPPTYHMTPLQDFENFKANIQFEHNVGNQWKIVVILLFQFSAFYLQPFLYPI